MWTVIYVVTGRGRADKVRSKLLEHGILADIRAAGMSTSGDGLFEILVLESEVEEANLILCQHACI